MAPFKMEKNMKKKTKENVRMNEVRKSPTKTKQYDEQINFNNINKCMKCCDNEKKGE